MLVHSIVTKHGSGKCLELDGSTIFQPSCRNGIIWQTLWYLMPKAFRRILIQWYWWCSTRPTAGLPALPATWPIQDPHAWRWTHGAKASFFRCLRSISLQPHPAFLSQISLSIEAHWFWCYIGSRPVPQTNMPLVLMDHDTCRWSKEV